MSQYVFVALTQAQVPVIRFVLAPKALRGFPVRQEVEIDLLVGMDARHLKNHHAQPRRRQRISKAVDRPLAGAPDLQLA